MISNPIFKRVYREHVRNCYFSVSTNALWIAYELGNQIQSEVAFSILKQRENYPL